jgi:cytochrome c
VHPGSISASIAGGLVLSMGLALGHVSARATGDAVRGAQAYEERCGACHSVDADRVGPRHAGVMGRKAGNVPGFAYSPALKASNIRWDEQTLDRWLTNPEALVPGQRMGYSLADPMLRADVIAYLGTLTAPRP